MTLYKKDWNENRVTKFIKHFNIKHMSFFIIIIIIIITVIC